MIIRFPTGLYRDVLPEEPSDSGNITFLISSTDPPRSSDLFLQIPPAQLLRPLPDKIFTREERRLTVGKLIFSVVAGGQNRPGSAKKAFEVGDILNFTDEGLIIASVEEVPKVVETRHDTNVLDLEELGLTASEIDDIIRRATNRKLELETELSSVKTSIADTEVNISENQKSINEANKALLAVGSIYPEDSDIIIKLSIKVTTLKEERSQLLGELSSLNERSKELFNKLLEIGQVVR